MGDKASTAESIDFSASTTSNSNNNTHQESFSSPLNNFLDGSEFLNSSSGHLNNKRPGIDDGIDQEWRPFGDSKGPSFPSRTISQNTTDTASTFPSTFDFGESDHNKSTTSTFSQMSDTKPAHHSTKAVNPPFTVPETSGLSPGELAADETIMKLNDMDTAFETSVKQELDKAMKVPDSPAIRKHRTKMRSLEMQLQAWRNGISSAATSKPSDQGSVRSSSNRRSSTASVSLMSIDGPPSLVDMEEPPDDYSEGTSTKADRSFATSHDSTESFGKHSVSDIGNEFNMNTTAKEEGISPHSSSNRTQEIIQQSVTGVRHRRDRRRRASLSTSTVRDEDLVQHNHNFHHSVPLTRSPSFIASLRGFEQRRKGTSDNQAPPGPEDHKSASPKQAFRPARRRASLGSTPVNSESHREFTSNVHNSFPAFPAAHDAAVGNHRPQDDPFGSPNRHESNWPPVDNEAFQNSSSSPPPPPRSPLFDGNNSSGIQVLSPEDLNTSKSSLVSNQSTVSFDDDVFKSKLGKTLLEGAKRHMPSIESTEDNKNIQSPRSGLPLSPGPLKSPKSKRSSRRRSGSEDLVGSPKSLSSSDQSEKRQERRGSDKSHSHSTRRRTMLGRLKDTYSSPASQSTSRSRHSSTPRSSVRKERRGSLGGSAKFSSQSPTPRTSTGVSVNRLLSPDKPIEKELLDIFRGVPSPPMDLEEKKSPRHKSNRKFFRRGSGSHKEKEHRSSSERQHRSTMGSPSVKSQKKSRHSTTSSPKDRHGHGHGRKPRRASMGSSTKPIEPSFEVPPAPSPSPRQKPKRRVRRASMGSAPLDINFVPQNFERDFPGVDLDAVADLHSPTQS